MACDSRSFHFVLVHGACFGGWCWYKVADLLMKDGHTVSSLDMAGQGIDPTDADHISTIEQYNQPLTDFFTDLPSNHKVILVGHSAGGYNVTYTMERMKVILVGHKIATAVFVTARMVLSGATAFDSLNKVLPRIGHLGDSTFSFANGEENKPTSLKFGKKFSHEFLLQNTPSPDICLTDSLLKRYPLWKGVVSYTKENYGRVLRAYVVAKDDKIYLEEFQRKMIIENPPQLDICLTDSLLKRSPCWEGAVSYTKEIYGRVPQAYVVAKEDKLFPEKFQRKMIEENPPQMVYEIEGSDHSPFFCKPDGLAHILLQIANRCVCN